MPRDPLSCPFCATKMKKVQLASGVEIDACDDHGVWLDVGELQQLVRHHERAAAPQKEGLASKLVDSAARGAGAGLGWTIASALIRRLFG